jgi:hypothetical protein
LKDDAMSEPDLSAHLKHLEETLLDPAVRGDRAQVSALLAEDFREFGSSGPEWTRQQILDLLATEDYTPPAIEDFNCERIAEDVALVTYRSVRINPVTGETSAALRSSLWIREPTGWRVRIHQGTPAQKTPM